jgi:hypothetical protein
MPDDLIRIRMNRTDLESLSIPQPCQAFVGRLPAAWIESGFVKGQRLPLDSSYDGNYFKAVAVLEILPVSRRHFLTHFSTLASTISCMKKRWARNSTTSGMTITIRAPACRISVVEPRP